MSSKANKKSLSVGVAGKQQVKALRNAFIALTPSFFVGYVLVSIAIRSKRLFASFRKF
jgi:cellobiose-specific phosphotransferase system component IIC